MWVYKIDIAVLAISLYRTYYVEPVLQCLKHLLLPVAETPAQYVIQDKKLKKRKNPFSFIFIQFFSVRSKHGAFGLVKRKV
jgi:hypothetical protein